VNDEELRSFEEFHSLKSVLMRFAIRAIPFVITSQSLLLTKPAETVLYRNPGGLLALLRHLSQVDNFKVYLFKSFDIGLRTRVPLYN
jgi:hypothetical protein